MNFVQITDKRGERTVLINLDNVTRIRRVQFGDIQEPRYDVDNFEIDEHEYHQILTYLKRNGL